MFCVCDIISPEVANISVTSHHKKLTLVKNFAQYIFAQNGPPEKYIRGEVNKTFFQFCFLTYADKKFIKFQNSFFVVKQKPFW